MQSGRSTRRVGVVGIALLLALGATAGVASAAAPGSGSDGKKEMASGDGSGRGGGYRAGAIGPDGNPVGPTRTGGLTKPADGGPTASAIGQHYVALYGFTIDPGTWTAAWQYCPEGMAAVGGGEFNTSLGGVTLHETYALSDGSGWLAKVTNDSGTPAQVTVYVSCVSGLTSYYQIYGGGGSGNGWAQAGAVCTTGTLLGGGGYTTALSGYATRTGPLQSGTDRAGTWMFAGRSSSDTVSVVAQAICGTGIDTYERVVAFSPNSGGLTSSSATCPAGMVALSGGGESFRLTDSYPVGENGWRVYVANDTGRTDGLVGAYAICGT
jgi:hypothetical protein